MAKKEELEDLLSDLAGVGDIKGGVVASRDGLLMASQLPEDADVSSIAAMAAAIVGTAETSTEELEIGKFQQAIVKASEGQYISVGCGEEAILMGLVDPDANLGLVLVEMRKIARKIGRII